MADDLKELRQQFEDDMQEWSEIRQERAKDMMCRAGDPWDPQDKQKREDAGRPWVTTDELSQYTNQIVNDMRVNPLSITFAPGEPITAGQEQIVASEKTANLYSDKMREIEYRSYAHEGYATAFESCVDGSYGYVRLVSEFVPGTFDQELRIKAVPDPNTVLPDPMFQRPDLADMRRCFVLEKRAIKDFKRDFPKAKVQDFDGILNDKTYSQWVDGEKILLAEYWQVKQVKSKLLKVQLPTVQPPSGMYGFRPPQAPPPIDIPASRWAEMPEGATVIQEREEDTPKVIQQLVNGVEVLTETTWPGPYIPIAGCMGRILYLDEGGTSKRIILSAIRLARDPFMAYCFYRTCELEAAGQITKNPYWAYEGQVTPEQQEEIKKSLHEPVAVLFAKALTTATGNQVLPLPMRNPQALDIAGYSVSAEEMRRAIQAAMGGSFLPTTAQKQNEKSKVALEYIGQSAARGTYHFFDHYKAMRRQVGVLVEAALDGFYDTKRQIAVRKRDETTERVWINDPANKDAIDVRGRLTVDVSDGQNVDSTREAASNFADMLLGSPELMQLLGPQKANKIAALAVKLKVKQTGIGPIGEEIVDIIDPPQDGEADPAQLQAQLQEAQQIMQMGMQEIEALKKKLETKEIEQQGKVQIEQLKEQFGAFIQELKGEQAKQLEMVRGMVDQRLQDDKQAHEAAMKAADVAHTDAQQDKAMLAEMAKPPVAGGNGNGASA